MELEKHQESFHIAYRSATMMFQLATQEIFDLAINTNHTLELLHDGVVSNGETQDVARDLLYRELLPIYE
ncbi:MAG: hypothetical protein KA253_04730, partial [Campylobacteraceae bacterium]|nr:hypothetical protein [Campylobacteraceae bacterium]